MTLVKYSWNPLEDNIMAEYDGAGNLLAHYTTCFASDENGVTRSELTGIER